MAGGGDWNLGDVHGNGSVASSLLWTGTEDTVSEGAVRAAGGGSAGLILNIFGTFGGGIGV